MSFRSGTRGWLAVVTAASLIGSLSSCGLEQIVGGGGTKTTETAGTTPAPGGATRVQPTYAPPVSYQPAGADSYEFNRLNGTLELHGQQPVQITFGFLMAQLDGPVHPLVAAGIDFFERKKAKPKRIKVDRGRGLWAETKEIKPGRGRGPGANRFYVLNRSAVAVTLNVFAPKGTPLTDAHRRMADRLIRSVRFESQYQTGSLEMRKPDPYVPFSFERPPGLRGGEQASGGQDYWVSLNYPKLQQTKVRISSYADAQDAHEAFLKAKRKAEDLGYGIGDTKRSPATASTLGRRIDEGYDFVVSAEEASGHYASNEHTVRKGRLLVTVYPDHVDSPTPSAQTMAGLNSILRTLKFLRPAL